MNITADLSPSPPWTGVKFTCEKCKAEYLLEAADHCQLRLVLNDHLRTYDAPACVDCGTVNVIQIDSAPAEPEIQAS